MTGTINKYESHSMKDVLLQNMTLNLVEDFIKKIAPDTNLAACPSLAGLSAYIN